MVRNLIICIPLKRVSPAVVLPQVAFLSINVLFGVLLFLSAIWSFALVFSVVATWIVVFCR